jgi:hypothetical protein
VFTLCPTKRISTRRNINGKRMRDEIGAFGRGPCSIQRTGRGTRTWARASPMASMSTCHLTIYCRLPYDWLEEVIFIGRNVSMPTVSPHDYSELCRCCYIYHVRDVFLLPSVLRPTISSLSVLEMACAPIGISLSF